MEGVLASLRCLFRQTGERKAQTCAKAIFRHLPTERKEISGEYPIDSLAGCAKKGIPKTIQMALHLPNLLPTSVGELLFRAGRNYLASPHPWHCLDALVREGPPRKNKGDRKGRP